MDSQNVKVYLAISGALIFLFILIIIIPFAKKPINNQQSIINNNPLPTSVEANPTLSSQSDNANLVKVPASFTGAIDEPIPQGIVDLAAQKKDLQQKVPIDLSAFSIDFDYGEDKFVVSLKDPKDQSQKEFESWRASNYSALGADQFILK